MCNIASPTNNEGRLCEPNFKIMHVQTLHVQTYYDKLKKMSNKYKLL